MYGYFAFLKFVYEPLKFCFDSPISRAMFTLQRNLDLKQHWLTMG